MKFTCLRPVVACETVSSNNELFGLADVDYQLAKHWMLWVITGLKYLGFSSVISKYSTPYPTISILGSWLWSEEQKSFRFIMLTEVVPQKLLITPNPCLSHQFSLFTSVRTRILSSPKRN
ncbi:Dysferlin [Manis pentadactyla]|nr:Dysferlin [Manis pentadactyla]